jgi:hypothetical protein
MATASRGGPTGTWLLPDLGTSHGELTALVETEADLGTWARNLKFSMTKSTFSCFSFDTLASACFILSSISSLSMPTALE